MALHAAAKDVINTWRLSQLGLLSYEEFCVIANRFVGTPARDDETAELSAILKRAITTKDASGLLLAVRRGGGTT